MQLMVNRGKAKGRFIKITAPRFLIGRDPMCQLRPLSDEVGLRHAELKVIAGIVLINDLGSENGTRVNGQRLTGQASLRTGDCIEIGPLEFTVLLDEPVGTKHSRRTAEDEITSWLTDEGDGESTMPPQTRQPPETTAVGTSPARVRAGSPSTDTQRRSSEGQVDDAIELLKAMTTRPG